MLKSCRRLTFLFLGAVSLSACAGYDPGYRPVPEAFAGHTFVNGNLLGGNPDLWIAFHRDGSYHMVRYEGFIPKRVDETGQWAAADDKLCLYSTTGVNTCGEVGWELPERVAFGTWHGSVVIGDKTPAENAPVMNRWAGWPYLGEQPPHEASGN